MQIVDAVLVTNGFVSRHRSGNLGLIGKIDIEKAFNHINWNFLIYFLQKWALEVV